MVSFVNDDRVRAEFDVVEQLRKIATALQVGVIENLKVGERSADMRQISFDRAFPDRFVGGLRNKERRSCLRA